ncbi:class I SAM-dependent methyltransferase [Helicobacter ibis]|uniref:Class I SAM-dependent methyltransferase n=1 Tax=Helicobacter ibis TaxID=2962633 RepID=A0ABT4VC85_9HELI|nr:class I SAM-dependent methyltransferase [Helicobacter ibis]MDA3968314.1 class I SAM-dependent methyltransferase [Helicobacter ibis]
MTKSTQEHWDRTYSNTRDINPNWKPIYYDFRSIASVIEDAILDFKPNSIFEVGCGDSLYLPYFLQNFKSSAGGGDLLGGGIDYSPNGVRDILERLEVCGVNADIFCEDFLKLTDGLYKDSKKYTYDLIYSLGVIEHFDNPKSILEIFSTFLSDNGILISIIPNFSFFSFHKLLCYLYQPKILAIHNLMNLKQLEEEHRLEGFRIIKSGYLGKFSLGIPAYGLDSRSIFGKNYDMHKKVGNKMAKFVWNRLANTYDYRGNSVFAPYIYCVIKKS